MHHQIVSCMQSKSPRLGLVLLLLFIFTKTVVLLNTLIAVVSEAARNVRSILKSEPSVYGNMLHLLLRPRMKVTWHQLLGMLRCGWVLWGILKHLTRDHQSASADLMGLALHGLIARGSASSKTCIRKNMC